MEESFVKLVLKIVCQFTFAYQIFFKKVYAALIYRYIHRMVHKGSQNFLTFNSLSPTSGLHIPLTQKKLAGVYCY